MTRVPEPPAPTFRRPGRGSAGASLRLRGDDFDGSNEAARDDLRKRIAGWARIVAVRLRAHGLDLAVCSVSDAGGPGALFLSCGASVRDSRAALVLGVDGEGVRAGLEVPPTQARSVRDQLADPARALALSAALESLPEQFALRVDGEDEASFQAPRCGVDELRPLLDRAAQVQRLVWIGWRVPRSVAVEHAALLDEQLEDALAALAAVYLLITGEFEGAAVLRSSRSGGRSRRNADDERERGSRGSPGPADSRRGSPRAREERSDRDADIEQEAEVERATDAAPRMAKGAEARVPPRVVFRRRKLGGSGGKNDPAPPIERGARVRVLEGAFSGKVGVVHELDGKGGARVMLGLLAVRLNVNNLAAQREGRNRPVLSTSHRKPIPVRS